MIGTFLLVAALSFKNRLVSRLARLREPRYLIGAIAGVAYFWFMFFRNHQAGPARRIVFRTVPMGDMQLYSIAAGVLIVMIVAWALPGDSGGLDFSEAEIAFLFPAPLKRRDLLLYKIIRAQPQALMSAFFLTVFGTARGKFVGVWLAVSVISIYFTLAALGRARLKLMKIGFVARLIAVVLLLGALSWYATTLAHQVDRRRWVGYNDAQKSVLSFLHLPPIRTLLFVPRAFAGAVVPASNTMLLLSCTGLVLLGVTFFFIANALNVSFEEASIGYSQRRAQRRERMRDDRIGGRVVLRRAPPLFRLGETGPPETAFIWKNVIALMRTNIVWAVLLLVSLAFIVGEAIYVNEPPGYKVCGMLVIILAAFFPILGAQLFANDLRLDMRRAEVLKSYPISGDRLVAAEVAAPLAVVTFFELLYLGSGSLLLRFDDSTNPLARFVSTPQFLVVGLLLTLPICAMQLLIRNATPIYFPAWVLRSKDDARGIVAAGQRIVVALANVLCLSIILIPAALVFLPSAFIAWKFFSGNPAGLAVATMPAIAVIAGEAWFFTKILGAQFERLDVSSEFDIGTV